MRPTAPSLPDGALFAFVMTTDPEVLLMIEARPVGGDSVWHYGFARMSMVNLRAQHKDRTSGASTGRTTFEDPNKPYVTLRAPDRQIESNRRRRRGSHFIPTHRGVTLMLASNLSRHGAIALGLALVASAWLVESPRGYGQQAASKVKEEKGKWVPLFQRHAGEYVIRVGQDAKGEARRLPEPVLRWWQPVRGGDDGALYLWVREGRPVAVVTFFTFKWPDGRSEHRSRTCTPWRSSRWRPLWRGNSVWHTSRPGLTFKPVPDASAPAGTAPARLRQMQAVVREFSANTIDDKGSTWPLRPLVKPLYRYEGKHDGALFALVQGTDPEAFIVLEARGEGKDAHWEYAVARFTDLADPRPAQGPRGLLGTIHDR